MDDPDPGPQWLLWAHQMRAQHSDLAKQIQQNTEAVAHAKLLEEQVKQLDVTHSALKDETKTIRVDLQLLSSNLCEVEKQCEAEFGNTIRRVTSLEEQLGNLLGVVERCKSQAETALQRQGKETPEWRMQQAHDLTGLKEYQRRENDVRKNEIDQLRAQFEKFKNGINRQGNCLPSDVPQAFETNVVLERSSHQGQADAQRRSPSQIGESLYEHHSRGNIRSEGLSENPENRSQPESSSKSYLCERL